MRLLKVACVALVVIMAVTAIVPGAVKAANPPANPQEEYVFVAYVTSIPFWTDPVAGFMAACDALGVKGTFTGPVEFDAAAQARTVEELIAKKPAGIVIFPADPDALSEPLKKAMEAGIPVICANSDVKDLTARYGYVGINNFEGGKRGGQIVVDLLTKKNGSPKGTVGIMTMPGVTVHEDRKNGYLAVLKDYPDIKVADIVNDKADPSVGVTVASALMQAHPDLDLIIGTDATSGASAARAVTEANMKGKVMIVAMDRDEDLLDYIADGTVSASLAQRNYLEEWLAVNYLYWLNHGSLKALPDWKAANAPQIPPNTDTGAMVITKDNVDQFRHAK